MSDPTKGKPSPLADLDWDDALDEWEKSTFAGDSGASSDGPGSAAPSTRPAATIAAAVAPPMSATPPPATAAPSATPGAAGPPRTSAASPSTTPSTTPASAPSSAAARAVPDGLVSRSGRPPVPAPARPDALPTLRRRSSPATAAVRPPPRPAPPSERALPVRRDRATRPDDGDGVGALFEEAVASAAASTAAPPPGGALALGVLAHPEAGLRDPRSSLPAPRPPLPSAPEEATALFRPEVPEELTASRTIPSSLLRAADDDARSARDPHAPPLPIDFEVPPPFLGRGAASVDGGDDDGRQDAGADDAQPFELDEELAAVLAQSLEWLDEECALVDSGEDRARAWLAGAEIAALLGRTDDAADLARRARSDAPGWSLARLTARQLTAPLAEVTATELDADAEAARSPTYRAHATLLAADAARRDGDAEGARARWRAAHGVAPRDPRPFAYLAADTLALRDAGAALVAGTPPAIERALAASLRARGLDRRGPPWETARLFDAVRRAREAVTRGALGDAAHALATLGDDPSVGVAALWASAALASTEPAQRPAAAGWLRALDAAGQGGARRVRVARALEAGDDATVLEALEGAEELDALDRSILEALSGMQTPLRVAEAEDDDALASLNRALEGARLPDGDAGRIDRALATAGDGDGSGRRRLALGRLLAAGAPTSTLAERAAAEDAPSDALAGLRLHVATRAGDARDLARLVAELPLDGDDRLAHDRALVAGYLAEPDDAVAAAASYAGAYAAEPTETALRLAAELDPAVNLAEGLGAVADEVTDGATASLLRAEGVLRAGEGGQGAQAELERAHADAPSLGLAAFLGERLARRLGDEDLALRWIAERRTAGSRDPLETAIDHVREALLVADRDPELAGTRLEEAHRAFPDDVALRDLYERLAPEPPADRAEWRARRATRATPEGRRRILLEAALEHELDGRADEARASAEAVLSGGPSPLAERLLERLSDDEPDALRVGEARGRASTEADPERRRRARLHAGGLAERAGLTPEAAAIYREALDETPDDLELLLRAEHVELGLGDDAALARVALGIARNVGDPGAVSAHAYLAFRVLGLLGRASELGAPVTLALALEPPPLWALRAGLAIAQGAGDDDATARLAEALADLAARGPERGYLLVRAAEAHARAGRAARAAETLELAAQADPGCVVTWGELAELRQQRGEPRAAAEACESLARSAAVENHQLVAWYDAALLWLDARDRERAIAAFEQAATLDVRHADVFDQLSLLYEATARPAELAALLERRLAVAEDPDERVRLEVARARRLVDLGELAAARAALDAALATKPGHPDALRASAILSERTGDHAAAERALVELSRAATSPGELRDVYSRLASLYVDHLQNFARAEVALREVLKRAPRDEATLTRLVDLHVRKGDAARAAEVQGELVQLATESDTRLARLVRLAEIHETVGREPRRAEQVLEAARREFPTSVVALRAQAELYRRQRQLPAMQILLDRAAGDARRAFAAGRFVPSLFATLEASYELRGRDGAARVVGATLSAIDGGSSVLEGAGVRALDPRLDELLAPEAVHPALRTLLGRMGEVLDAAFPLDLAAMQARPLTTSTLLGRIVAGHTAALGLREVQIFVTPRLGRVCVPAQAIPPALLVGEALVDAADAPIVDFIVLRALKLVLARAAALVRGPAASTGGMLAGLFVAMNPQWKPTGLASQVVQESVRRMTPVLQQGVDPTLGVLALEAAGALGGGLTSVGPAVLGWADRAALLAVGDPSIALEAIAWGSGEAAAPTDAEARHGWAARTAEVRDLLTFTVSDAYLDARAKLGLDRGR